MRFITELTARADAAYDNTYHHKLRGRIWQALEGTQYEAEHTSSDPVGISFSSPFPWGDLEAGDQRYILVAATREDLLAEVAADFLDEPELNLGSMLFTIENIQPVDPDVGPPRTCGRLRTETGLLAKVPPRYKKPTDPEGTDTFWHPDHGLGAFKEYIQTQLQRRHDRFAPSGVPGPQEVDEPLFTGYDHQKEYALPAHVSTEEQREFVLHKWSLKYTVRDATHRYHLNLALDAGLGGRTSMGFGFVNIPKEARV